MEYECLRNINYLSLDFWEYKLDYDSTLFDLMGFDLDEFDHGSGQVFSGFVWNMNGISPGLDV